MLMAGRKNGCGYSNSRKLPRASFIPAPRFENARKTWSPQAMRCASMSRRAGRTVDRSEFLDLGFDIVQVSHDRLLQIRIAPAAAWSPAGEATRSRFYVDYALFRGFLTRFSY